MKKILLAAVCMVSVMAAGAQTPPNFPKTAAPPRTYTTVTPSSFSTSLIIGTLTLNKEFKKGDGDLFVPIYTLIKDDASFNGRKPIQVSLSRQSFDSVFTKTNAALASKWAVLNKFIEDNKISLATEAGWIDMLKHFNGLQ